MTDDLMKRSREWLQACVNAATRGGTPEEADLEAFLLVHLDGEPARLAAAKTEAADRAWDEAVKVTELEQAHVRLRAVAAREEQREALGISCWPVLIPFIAAMVRKLDANKPKKGGREGWSKDEPSALVRRVIDEAEELEHAVDTQPRGRILAEAADVANMAMMVADSVGAIRDVSIESTLTATPLGDEVKALRARVAELERSEKTLDAVCAVLGREVGNRGDSEGAVDVAERIIRERDEAVAALRALLPEVYGTHSPPTVGYAIDRHRIIAQARAVLAKYPEGER